MNIKILKKVTSVILLMLLLIPLGINLEVPIKLGAKELQKTINKINPQSQEDVKKIVEDYINNTSFDDMLKEFGGRSIIEGALNSDNHIKVDNPDDANIDKYQLDDSYANVKANASTVADKIATKFVNYSNGESNIQDDVSKLIFVNIYFNKWYNIKIADHNLADEMFYAKDNSQDILDIAQDFIKKPEHINSNKTGDTYKNVISKYYEEKTLGNQVEKFVKEYGQTEDYNSWFKNYFKGEIIDYDYSQSIYPEKYHSLWDKLTQTEDNGTLRNLFLPLLTLENQENLVLTQSAGTIFFASKKLYGDNYEERIKTVLDNFENYQDNLIRTQTAEEKERIVNTLKENNTIAIFDSEKVVDEGYYGKWNYLDKTNSLSQLYKTMQYYEEQFASNNAQAGHENMMMELASFETNKGGTLAHEFNHAMGYILLNGNIKDYGYRKPGDLETIAVRIDNTWFDDDGLGFNLYNKDKGAGFDPELVNTGDRFQSPEDLNQYFKGYVGLVYSLNTAIADVVLNMPASEQVGYIREWNESDNTIKTLNEEQIKNLNLKTTDDLVDKNIGIFDKSIKDGKVPNDGGYGSSYYTLDSHYYASKSEEEMDGDEYGSQVQMIDELFTLDTKSGWDAVNMYFSNGTGYQNDTDALRKIFADESMTFSKFRKMQLNRFGDQVRNNGLKGEDYETTKSTIQNNLNDLRKIKVDYYKKYMKSTNEFRDSIYNIGESTLNVKDVEINVGDTWNAEDNFISATDKEGNTVEFKDITVEGADTVDTSKAGEYKVTYKYDGLEKEAKVIVKEVKSSNVIIKYETIDGEEITREDKIVGNVGESYETTPRTILGWTLIETPDNANGKFSEEDTTVTYVYDMTTSTTCSVKVDEQKYDNGSLKYTKYKIPSGLKECETNYREDGSMQDYLERTLNADGQKTLEKLKKYNADGKTLHSYDEYNYKNEIVIRWLARQYNADGTTNKYQKETNYTDKGIDKTWQAWTYDAKGRRIQQDKRTYRGSINKYKWETWKYNASTQKVTKYTHGEKK